MKTITKLFFAILTACLISCGGGGSGESDASTNISPAGKDITMQITQEETFSWIGNKYVVPSSGNVFHGYLIKVTNTDSETVDSSRDASWCFSLTTKDGFVYPAENTSSQAWQENRAVWGADSIPAGQTRTGWVVFDIPANAQVDFISYRDLATVTVN